MQISYKKFNTLISFAVFFGITATSFLGCKPKKGQFSGENAHQHVQELVNFGPRIPGSQAIENARLYIEEKLQEFGWFTVRQSFNDDTPNGSMKFINLRARFSMVTGNGIDWKADDPEIARRVELVFFDGEEALVDFTSTDGLYGSRHYAKFWRSAPINKKPRAAYVLDLVGDKQMRIDPPYDSPSMLLSELYSAAQSLGYRSLFGISSTPITDDHVPLNAAGIPALDVIDSRYISKGKWHTSRDDLNSIAKENLEIVGAVVLELMKKKIKK